MSLANRQLNRVRRGGGDNFHGLVEVFNSLQEAAFIEETVVDGDVEAAIGLGVEQAIEAKLFHIF